LAELNKIITFAPEIKLVIKPAQIKAVHILMVKRQNDYNQNINALMI